MTWNDLKNNDITYIVEYINSKLNNSKSLTKVAIELGVSESSIRKYLTKRGYKRINDEYIFIGDNSMTKVVNSKSQSNNDNIFNMTIEDDNSNNVVIDNQFKNNIISLAKDYDKIQNVLNWFENKEDTNVIEVVQDGIKIDLPSKDAIRTTVRLNKDAWNLFDEFCEKFREFNKSDLMSMALLEYIKKYDK
ncbi:MULTISPECIES: integrase [unclassified Clostridioides]|uniref:integrase n=1 Tax=unclassified Clostridioides TaxID=2635829 RepID=UPI001D0FDD39|nr:integrase [Clostridioides sp. ZZV14-6045]MCC0731307.1 integrase [Clostridioides sp. ZZV14-6048]MCC0735261.1 integrase [Clostridioides sp. ZZV14-6009]MCC0739889.1 integrase [Clostridioides sp. ZZV14-5902]